MGQLIFSLPVAIRAIIGVIRTGFLVLCAAWAQAQVCDESPVRFVDSSISDGRVQLAQGIALYEARNFLMAERALQAALFAGLSDRGEQASAHKHLAYVYCTRQELQRCEASFDAAFVARPAFNLQAFELQGTPWRDAYVRAFQRASTRCPVLRVENADKLSLTNLAGGLILHSSVIAIATPLVVDGALNARFSAKSNYPSKPSLPNGHNALIRVKPWAQVYVNGKQVGVSPPLLSLRLEPGRHTVELRNTGFESYRRVLQITDGSIVKLIHDFDAQ